MPIFNLLLWPWFGAVIAVTDPCNRKVERVPKNDLPIMTPKNRRGEHGSATHFSGPPRVGIGR